MRLTNIVDELRRDHPWIDVIGVETVTATQIVPGDAWKSWGPQYAGSGPLGVTVHHTGGSGSWVGIVRFEWNKFPNVKATCCNINLDGRVAVMSAGSAATNGTVTKRRFSRGMGGANGDQWTIELHNRGNGAQAYPEAQMRSMLAVCYTVNRLSGNQFSDVCTHREVASPFGRKSDPAMARNIEGPYAGRIRPTGSAETWNPDDLRAVAVDFAANIGNPPPPPPPEEEDVIIARRLSDGATVLLAGHGQPVWLEAGTIDSARANGIKFVDFTDADFQRLFEAANPPS